MDPSSYVKQSHSSVYIVSKHHTHYQTLFTNCGLVIKEVSNKENVVFTPYISNHTLSTQGTPGVITDCTLHNLWWDDAHTPCLMFVVSNRTSQNQTNRTRYITDGQN